MRRNGELTTSGCGFDFEEGQLAGEMAGCLVTGFDFPEFGRFRAALVFGILTARMELAAGGCVCRIGHVTLEGNTAHLVVGVGDGHC